MDTQGPSEGTERASSSSAQFGNNLDGSMWNRHHDMEPAGAKAESLIVPKVHQRPTSVTEMLKGAIRQKRGVSLRLCDKIWRSNTPKIQHAATSDDDDHTNLSANVSCQISTAMGQVAPEHWNAYFVLSPCVTITSDVSALNEGQHTV
jgi:hypothetical protein